MTSRVRHDRLLHRIPAWFVFSMLLALTAMVYIPSLAGGYIFDDGYYFLDNVDVHAKTLDAASFTRAALSQAGTTQFRALGMLSFAINYYFTGVDPFGVKLTNLVIHLCNGILLFVLLKQLLRLQKQVMAGNVTRREQDNPDLLSAVVAGAWLLLPINLTAVAYVSQRLEALANIFVFCGLIWYLNARLREYVRADTKFSLPLSLFIFTALGVCTKESAVTLPFYAACVDFALTGFRNQDHRFSKPVLATYAVVLLLPLIIGLTWIAHWDFSTVHNFRTFTMAERLLTEPRILIDYVKWTLLPSLNELTFYHDDIAVSRSLFDPPTTALAIGTLVVALAVAIWQRKSRPLFCLGILWFFAGHILTATIVPLELVFEHRNYFASVGLLLAAASLIVVEPLFPKLRVRALLACGFIGLFAFTTFLRAEEWSHPLRLALAEASKRPNSPRAQYELGRTLILAAGKDEHSPLLAEAQSVLQKSAYRQDSGISGLQALIFLDCRMKAKVDPRLWTAMEEKLQSQPPSQTDVNALEFLYHAQLRGDCPVEKQELLNAFTAALSKSNGDLNLTSAYAEFALSELGDVALAERMFTDVVERRPTVPVYRENLVRFLAVTGQFDRAQAELDALKKLNYYDSLDREIDELAHVIENARAAQKPPQSEPLSAGAPKP